MESASLLNFLVGRLPWFSPAGGAGDQLDIGAALGIEVTKERL